MTSPQNRIHLPLPMGSRTIKPLATCVSLIALCAGGCAPKSGDASISPEVTPPTTTTDVVPGAFVPVRVRIHPLTRMLPAIPPDTPARIDAHIELIDQWGLPVRALGELRFVARLDEADANTVAQTQPNFPGVVVWNIDMTDPEANASQYYDRVTRTYHIALSDATLVEARSPLTLDVVFVAPGVATLPATMRLDIVRRDQETSPQPE